MSVCTFIAADVPLQEHSPAKEYPFQIDIDRGTVYDGGADDNFFLYHFPDVSYYTKKGYGVALQWRYTDGRAEQLIRYIEDALKEAQCVELWTVWLMDHYEFDERPVHHRQVISAQELSAEHIRWIDGAEIWNTPDKMYPGRPSFYCLEIRKS